MMQRGDEHILVTLGGECFSAQFQGEHYDHTRGGGTYVFGFLVNDKAASPGRETFQLLVLIQDLLVLGNEDFAERKEIICLNAIRRAFDEGSADFVARPLPAKKEVAPRCDFIQAFGGGDETPDPEVRAYLMHKAYWLGYRYNQDPGRYWVDFEDPLDLDYLRISAPAIKRNLWLLKERGLLEMAGGFSTVAKPTPKLIESYESRSLSEIDGERIFPKGSQWDSYKEIAKILESATTKLYLVDNYVSPGVLDMLTAVKTSVRIGILTQNISPDFRVALARFNSQYPQQIEVRKHGGQVHDRFIVIDDKEVYSLGASIKDAGNKLWILDKLEQEPAVSQARKEIEALWQSAAPIT